MTQPRALDPPLADFFLIAFGWTWGIAGLMIFAPDFTARMTGSLGLALDRRFRNCASVDPAP